MTDGYLPDFLELLGNWWSPWFGIGHYSVFLNLRTWVHSNSGLDSACKVFFSWKSCVIAAFNCLHFLLFYCLYFACFWNVWPRSEKDTKERTDPGRSQSTGPHQHLRDAGLTSQRWQQEEPSSETHRLTTLWCGAVLPALSAAPNAPSSISSMLISNTKQNATSRAEEGWAAAQHDILTSSWGSIWVLVGETLRLLPWWRG